MAGYARKSLTRNQRRRKVVVQKLMGIALIAICALMFWLASTVPLPSAPSVEGVIFVGMKSAISSFPPSVYVFVSVFSGHTVTVATGKSATLVADMVICPSPVSGREKPVMRCRSVGLPCLSRRTSVTSSFSLM
jgi:hypothetical protein